MNPTKEPKIPVPERFNGNRKNYRTFMSQVDAIFTLNASRFPDDKTKIIYIGSLLTGDAAKWFEAMTRSETGNLMNDYKVFKTIFEQLFSDPYSEANACRELKKLRQGSLSATAYAMKFLSLSVDTKYNEPALLEYFRSGLNPQIKDILATTVNLPQKFEPFMNFVIGIDNRLYERRQEQRFERSTNFGESNYRQQQQPTPMEIDSIQLRNNNSKPRRRLTEAEKQYRRDNNLCFFCGAEDHIADRCPEKSKNGRRHQAQGTN